MDPSVIFLDRVLRVGYKRLAGGISTPDSRNGKEETVINTIDINKNMTTEDGFQIRRCAVENNVAMFTSLETVKVLLDVLEEITLGVSTIDKME